jgi:adenylylsulfate kinase
LFGLPGAGKSTLAAALAEGWRARGQRVKLLDGDELRLGLCRDLGYTEADRHENIRRAAETAKLFLNEGIWVIAAFITPRQALRQLARQIIGPERLALVFVRCPVATCQARDPKGHYAEAARGGRPLFTGIGASFEEPTGLDSLCVDTSLLSLQACLAAIAEVMDVGPAAAEPAP